MTAPTNFVVHDAAGKIFGSGACLDSDLALQTAGWPEGAAVLSTDIFHAPDDHYVDAGAVLPRPAFPGTLDKPAIAANGADSATLSGLPNLTTLSLAGPHGTSDYIIADGVFVFATTWPGLYVIKMTPPFPARPGQVTIHAS